ncbi:distal tail protein Dit [Bacillus licheniformis]
MPGVDGAKLKGVRYTERTIEIDTLFIAADDAELRKILEEINYILATDKEEALIFSDEPDRTYYAVFSTAQESEGQNGVYKVTLAFVCPDPEKEGGETVFITGDPDNPYTNQIKNGDFREGKDYWYSSNNIGEVVPVSSDQIEFKHAFEIKQPNVYLIYYLDDPMWWVGKKGYASCWANVQNSAFDSGEMVLFCISEQEENPINPIFISKVLKGSKATLTDGYKFLFLSISQPSMKKSIRFILLPAQQADLQQSKRNSLGSWLRSPII